jgi:hypothetical protein
MLQERHNEKTDQEVKSIIASICSLYQLERVSKEGLVALLCQASRIKDKTIDLAVLKACEE